MGIVLVGIQNGGLNAKVKNYLTHLGAIKIQEAKNTDHLIRMARRIIPEYIILDPGSFGPRGLETSKILAREKIAPIIFILGENLYRQSIEEIINREAYALTYLTAPFSEEQLRTSVITTLAAFKKIKGLEKKVIKLNEEMAERKILNRAKALLIEKKGWTEPQAHKFIQKQSMNSGKTIKVVAQKIIDDFF